MAYPTVEGVVRVQVRMQGPSGLPEDIYVNTWYWLETTPTTTWENDGFLRSEVWSRLDAFYSGDDGAGSIASFLSERIQSVRYVMHPLYIDPPRYPIDDVAATWTGNGAVDPLPDEVSLVSSFYTNTPRDGGDVIRQRRRGRHYLGPLNANAHGPGANAFAPADGALDIIADRASALLALQGTDNLQWVVVSPTEAASDPGNAVGPVEGGWIDNAFDTQRSRGNAPSSRDTWGAPIE